MTLTYIEALLTTTGIMRTRLWGLAEFFIG
jgi:hypothetical protein